MESLLAAKRSLALAVLAIFALPAALSAAELPSQMKKPKAAEAVRHCNVAGSPGMLAANGVCVKISGYVSAGFKFGPVR